MMSRPPRDCGVAATTSINDRDVFRREHWSRWSLLGLLYVLAWSLVSIAVRSTLSCWALQDVRLLDGASLVLRGLACYQSNVVLWEATGDSGAREDMEGSYQEILSNIESLLEGEAAAELPVHIQLSLTPASVHRALESLEAQFVAFHRNHTLRFQNKAEDDRSGSSVDTNALKGVLSGLSELLQFTGKQVFIPLQLRSSFHADTGYIVTVVAGAVGLVNMLLVIALLNSRSKIHASLTRNRELTKGVKAVTQSLCDSVVALNGSQEICKDSVFGSKVFDVEMLGRPFSELLRADDKQRFQTLVEAASKTAQPVCMPATLLLSHGTSETHLLLVAMQDAQPRFLVGIRLERQWNETEIPVNVLVELDEACSGKNPSEPLQGWLNVKQSHLNRPCKEGSSSFEHLVGNVSQLSMNSKESQGDGSLVYSFTQGGDSSVYDLPRITSGEPSEIQQMVRVVSPSSRGTSKMSMTKTATDKEVQTDPPDPEPHPVMTCVSKMRSTESTKASSSLRSQRSSLPPRMPGAGGALGNSLSKASRATVASGLSCVAESAHDNAKENMAASKSGPHILNALYRRPRPTFINASGKRRVRTARAFKKIVVWRYRAASLVQLLERWNCVGEAGSCCPWHINVKAAIETLHELGSKCHAHWQPVSDWQCGDCGMLYDKFETACVMCGVRSKVAPKARHAKKRPECEASRQGAKEEALRMADERDDSEDELVSEADSSVGSELGDGVSEASAPLSLLRAPSKESASARPEPLPQQRQPSKTAATPPRREACAGGSLLPPAESKHSYVAQTLQGLAAAKAAWREERQSGRLPAAQAEHSTVASVRKAEHSTVSDDVLLRAGIAHSWDGARPSAAQTMQQACQRSIGKSLPLSLRL
eukprot:TRINITY_DN82190_c0_g1_i1.p1 TRINITY_DN82190_c0_g1~~TRINITY_DN82190_c0_g1_i1.p1  ORF type:complete len:880 (+),score=171.90 TRINITY_DN82190_c0_g1_i1:178-2817(+)